MKKHNIAQKGKRALSMLLVALMVLSCWVWVEPASLEANAATLTGNSNYLFAYFTGTSIEGQTIHLAVSEDGLNYTALSNNEPVIVPSKGTGCVRDPYLWYNENDGYYYILATDLDFTDTGSDYSDNSESFIIWRSKDLVNWYDETMIDVKAILGRLGINNNNMQAVWAPQVLWDGSDYVVYFSLQCDATSNGSWNPLTIVYLKTKDLLDQDKYGNYGVIHNPGRHVIDADIIKKPNSNQYYMFYKDEAASGGIQSIYYMVSDNGPTGPYYAPDNANDGRGPQLFSEIGKNLEGCNSFFDDNGNLITFVDEYGYWNSLTNQNEAHFHVSSSSDFNTFTTLPDSSHNINSLSPRHGSVVKITDEEYNRLIAYASEITSSSFPETEVLSDHLVGRYFTTSDYTYNAANGKNDLSVTDGAISATTDASGDYYAYFNAAGAEINLAELISDDLNIKDGFTITFSASAPSTLGSNARFFDISNNWSQRTNPEETYLHMSPVADSNGLYVGAYNGPVTTQSWTWASQGRNYNDGVMHDYIISFADGNMILYIDGELAMKRDRFNMNTEYGDNFLADNWYQSIGNSTMRIGKSEWSDPLFTGSIQNLCIYDCSLSYYDVQKMQKIFDDQAGKTTVSKIVVPETVYMKPSTGESKTSQYYVNNTMHSGTNEVNLENFINGTGGVMEFYIPGAKHFIVEVNTITSGIGDIILTDHGRDYGTYEKIQYDADEKGYFSYRTLGFYIDGTGISAGKTALAEWKITVIMDDGSTTTHYAYSTLYAPYLNPVGSAILLEGRYYSNNKLYASSMAWVSGVHSFTNDPAANYYARTDKMVPLINGGAIGTGDNEDNPDTNWISASAGSNTLPTASFRYNQVKGSSGKLGALGVYRSPVANLTIDTSRYSNFNQIPNLTVGFNYTDKENSGEVYWYVSDYTDGDKAYFKDYSRIASRDDVNSDAGYYYNIQGNLITNTGVNQAQVSTGAEHNAQWDRAVKPGTSNTYIFKTGAYAYRSYLTGKGAAYSVNYVQVNGTNVDKTELRNLVLKSTYFNESDYTSASWSTFKTALQNAAEALGNPANSDIATEKTNLENAINALQTTVTLNANGGTINGSATTTFNQTVGDNTKFSYDLSAYTPVRDGYVFKGWSTDKDVLEGSTSTVTTGLMPTLYAIWGKRLNVTFDNLFDFSEFEIGRSGVRLDERTDTGFTITSLVEDGNTGFSYTIPVESGKTYIFSADMEFVQVSGGFDMYIHTLDANKAGETTATVDTSNGARREGNVYMTLSGQTDNGNKHIKFTAGSNTSYIKIRFDANTPGNKLTVNNIRIYEVGTVAEGVSYESSKEVVNGDPYGTLPVPTRAGYDFDGWVDANGNVITADTIVNSETTVNLFSTWKAQVYAISFLKNGADSTNEMPTQDFTYGGSTTLQANAYSRKGYEFTGWNTDPNGNGTAYADKATVTNITGPITLYAQWKIVTYTITYIVDGGTINGTAPETYNVNSSVTIPGAEKAGFTFGGWAVSGGKDWSATVNAGDTISGKTGDVTLTAQWTITSAALEPDYVAIDFYRPVLIDPVANDEILLAELDGSDDYTLGLDGASEKFSVVDNKIRYNVTKDAGLTIPTETVDYTVTLADGKTLTSTITVTLASNVYYEEDMLTITASDNLDWEPKGSSRLSNLIVDTSAKDIYGYDEAYDVVEDFSNGTYLYSKVTSTDKKSDNASFEFYGNGFDLIGACGQNTGIQTVRISKKNDAGTYKLIKMYIVDTYYNGALLHQTPILTYRGTGEAGQYKVETTATFLNSATALKATNTASNSSAFAKTGAISNVSSAKPSKILINELESLGFETSGVDVEVLWMDENSAFNGGTGALNASVFGGSVGKYLSGSTQSLDNYIDGFRVYKNGGKNYIDSEKNPTYYNIVDGIGTGAFSGNFIAIEGNFTNVFGNGFEYINYINSNQPKGEIYLPKDHAVAFTFSAEYISDGIADIMLGMRVVEGTVVPEITAKIDGTAVEIKDNINVNSATEMYYDISDDVKVSTVDGTVTILVANTSDGVLAVNNLKLVNGRLVSEGTVGEDVMSGSNAAIGGTAANPTPVAPDANQGEAGNVEDIPEIDDNTSADAPAVDTEIEDDTAEDSGIGDITSMLPGMPASVASFLELLFKLLTQLLSSFGF